MSKIFKARTLLLVVLGLICTVFSQAVCGQELSTNQWLDLLGAENPTAYEYFTSIGPEAAPILKDAIENKWAFHAYIPQRTIAVKVLNDINDTACIPALKSALILEPSVRQEAVDAVLSLEELSMPDFLAELLMDSVDYQAAQLEMFKKLLDQDEDLIKVLEDTFDILVENQVDKGVIDSTADFVAKFIIEDKKVVETPKPITREMIMQALLQQQQQAEQENGRTAEKVDINQQLYQFLAEQIKQKNHLNRALGLRTVGRFADLVRGLELTGEFSVEQFVPNLLAVLENTSEDMNNRLLAASALEQILPAKRIVMEAFIDILDEPGIDSEIQWVAVRFLETAGSSLDDLVYDLWKCALKLEPAMRWRIASAFVHTAREDEKIAAEIHDLLQDNDADPDLQFYAECLLAAVEKSAGSSVKQNASAIGGAEKKTPAFPGAEGRGAMATGGRGQEVYIVTNIKNAGPGSLRDAVSKPNRTIVFAVSGTIESRAQLKTAANITIAGQTAPGDGIAVVDYPTLIGGSNSIVRFLRFRLGDRQGLTNSDALNIDRYISDVILDHCSVSWGTDEVFSSYDNENITVQYCMFGEGLNWLNHSAVGLWGPRATYHHNLIYSNKTRHPKLAYLGDIVDFNNNVIYNWKERSVYTGSQGRINFIGNYFKPGPATNNSVKGQLIQPDGNDVRLYIEGNIIEGNQAVNENNWRGVTKSALQVKEPYESTPMTIHSAEEAYDIALREAGAYLPKRDAVDERIINDILNSTGDIIIRQAEVGGFPILNSVLAPVDSDKDGMPDMWEIYHGLNPFDPNDRNYDRIGDGYTNLEEYLNTLIEPHELWP